MIEIFNIMQYLMKTSAENLHGFSRKITARSFLKNKKSKISFFYDWIKSHQCTNQTKCKKSKVYLSIQNLNSNKIKIVSNIKLHLPYVTPGMIFKYAWPKQ